MKRDAYIYERSPTVVRTVQESGRQTTIETRRAGWTKGTSWTAIVPLPDGRRRQFYGPTEVAVNEKVGAWRRRGGQAEEVHRAPKHRYIPRSKAVREMDSVVQSASTWLTEWARKGRPGKWDERRYKDAAWLISHHVARHWDGGLSITEVTETAVGDLLRKLDDRPTTQDNLRRLLRTAFRDCTLLEKNPVPPKPRGDQKEESQSPESFRVLTHEEWQALVSECLVSEDPLASAVVVALECGLRSSEVRALRWGDYDKKAGVLDVRRSVIRADDQRPHHSTVLIRKAGKTPDSVRRVPIPPVAIEALEEHELREVTTEKDWDEASPGHLVHLQSVTGYRPAPTDLIWPALGRSGDPKQRHRQRPLDGSRLCKVLDRLRVLAGISGRVCPSCHGITDPVCPACERPISVLLEAELTNRDELIPPRKANDLCPHCEQAGPPLCRDCLRPLTTLRFHDLRHSNATALVEKGTPEPVICERLGWSPGSKMLARYSHPTTQGKDAAVAAIASITGDTETLLAERARRIEARQAAALHRERERKASEELF